MTNLFSKFVERRFLERTGAALVVVSVLLLVLTFFPVLKEEVKYQMLPQQTDKEIVSRADAQKNNLSAARVLVPVNEEFGIVIPKIGANAAVVPDVDWQDEAVYQRALTQGVAQARGTANPGEQGNVFLFSHSGVDFLQANRYNALFYLIDKLQSGDEIVLFYHQEKFVYRVTDKKIVAPDSLEYLAGDPQKKTLTLMTCWPAGTTLERLLVIATLDSSSPPL